MRAQESSPLDWLNTARMSSVQRLATLLVAAVLVTGGAAYLLRPFLVSSSNWKWDLSNRAVLADATVNAEVQSIDSHGVRLSPQAARSISLITPPLDRLSLPPDAGRTVSIEAALPGVPESSSRLMRVRLLWQTAALPEYRYETREVSLNQQPGAIVFSLPKPVNELHRLGVQFPDVTETVEVRSISLPVLSIRQRLALAAAQVTATERIANRSVNFFIGPRILGHPFNDYLISLIACSVGIYGFVKIFRRRRIRYITIGLVTLAFWFVADTQATWNLFRQAKTEITTLRGRAWPYQIAIIYGRDTAWAYEQLLGETEPGARFAVLSDDPFGPAHRIDYLLAPQRIRCEDVDAASFLVIIHASKVAYDASTSRFRYGEGPWLDVEKIAEFSPEVYLLRIITCSITGFTEPGSDPSSEPTRKPMP